MLIYHVDDNSAMRVGVATVLAGMTVGKKKVKVKLESFGNHEEALLAIKERGPAILIQDLRLGAAVDIPASPRFGGAVSQPSLDLMKAAADAGAAVIVLSNHPDSLTRPAQESPQKFKSDVRKAADIAGDWKFLWLTKNQFDATKGLALKAAISEIASD